MAADPLSSAVEQVLFTGRPELGRPLTEALPELAGQQRIDLYAQVYRTGEPVAARHVLSLVALEYQ